MFPDPKSKIIFKSGECGEKKHWRVESKINWGYLAAYMPLVKSLGMGINFVDSWAKYWGKGPNSSFGALKNLFSKWEEIN